MKLKTLLVASALAATGVVGASTHPASAGCGVSITVDNDETTPVTVNWAQSQVRVSALGIPATWATLGSSSSNVGANSSSGSDELTRAFSLGWGCGLNRQYKISVSNGSSTWFEYFGWTTNVNPFIQLHR